jgi:Domain of unknown function (DUF4160)
LRRAEREEEEKKEVSGGKSGTRRAFEKKMRISVEKVKRARNWGNAGRIGGRAGGKAGKRMGTHILSDWVMWWDETMPTVLRIDWPRVVGYFKDRRPPHVHVMGKGCEAVFELNCPAGPVRVWENYGFKRREIARPVEELTNQMSALCGAWEDIPGNA